MLLAQNSDCIAAVLVDIPLEDGTALRSLVEACQPGTPAEIPVIALVVPTGNGQGEELAFIVGAADVVRKPYTTLSIRRRVQVLTSLYAHKLHLEKLVEAQNETIRNANQTVLDTLSAVYSLGYGAFGLQEIAAQFGNALRNLVLPEDRYILDEMLKGNTDNSRLAECLYRLQHRSGKPIRVIDRCRIHIGISGRSSGRLPH